MNKEHCYPAKNVLSFLFLLRGFYVFNVLKNSAF